MQPRSRCCLLGDTVAASAGPVLGQGPPWALGGDCQLASRLRGYAEGHYAEGHYAEGHYAEGHYAEGHYSLSYASRMEAGDTKVTVLKHAACWHTPTMALCLLSASGQPRRPP